MSLRGHLGSGYVYWPSPIRQGGKWRYRKSVIVDGKPGPFTMGTLEICEPGPGQERERGKITRSASKTMARKAIEELAALEREAAERAMADPTTIDPATITLEIAFREWYERKIEASKKKRGSTKDEIKGRIEVLKKILTPEKIVSTISFDTVEKLFTVWLRDRSGRRKLAYLGLLQKFFRWCGKMGYARLNPADQLLEEEDLVEEWRDEVSKTHRGQALALEEQVKLLEKAREPWTIAYERKKGPKPFKGKLTLEPPKFLFPILLVGMKTGLRRGNLVGPNAITWGDLHDLDKPGQERLAIDGARMKTGEPLGVIVNPKTPLERNLGIPLHPEVGKALREWRASLKRVPRKNDPVFEITRRGNKTKKGTVTQFNKSLEAALARAGLGDRGLRFHDAGRHTFITTFETVNPGYTAAKQKLAGHQPESMSDEYTHLTVEALRAPLARLPWFFPKDQAAKTQKITCTNM